MRRGGGADLMCIMEDLVTHKLSSAFRMICHAQSIRLQHCILFFAFILGEKNPPPSQLNRNLHFRVPS